VAARTFHAKEAQMTSISSRPPSDGNAQTAIDRAELRSILSNLSHELSRPLTSLRAGFDLLLAESSAPINQHQRGHLLTMVSLCDDILQLTRSYLDYAAVVHGSRPLCLGSFTIGALVGEINRQFAPIAEARSLDWKSRSETPDVVVVTDASRCQQILGNLVSNALKYTPAGGTIRLGASADAHNWSVTVSDTGPGIPPEAAGQIFEPFFRLARDEHSGVEGSGLGLAICRELVQQLNGAIQVESALGAGTTISVCFPLMATPAAELPISEQTPVQPSRRAGPRRKTTAAHW
jgi:signal transduction histidine kinase